MTRSMARAVGAMLLAGCGGADSPASTPEIIDVPLPRALQAADPVPDAAAPPASSSALDGDAAPPPSAACVTAFDDQRTIRLGPEATIHPAREAAFLRTCTGMPPLYQRCASPLHQIEHEAECAPVHEDDDRAARAAWRRTFDLLSDPRPDLPPVP